MVKKLLSIKEIEVDDDVYPRNNYNWLIAFNYSNAIKSGSKFPAITVAKLGKKYMLVDGRHRLEAYKIVKKKHIQVEVVRIKNKNDIFVLSVKLNIGHGYQFSPHEKAQIVVKLQDMRFNLGQISKIICIPKEKIVPFVAKKMTHTITGVPVVLKSPIQHLAGVPIPDEVVQEQKIFSVSTQSTLVEQMITLLFDDNLLLDDPQLLDRVRYLGQLITQKLRVQKVRK